MIRTGVPRLCCGYNGTCKKSQLDARAASGIGVWKKLREQMQIIVYMAAHCQVSFEHCNALYLFVDTGLRIRIS